jgi:hypothetical protein
VQAAHSGSRSEQSRIVCSFIGSFVAFAGEVSGWP